MFCYLLEYNNNIIGIYDNYDLAIDFILSCFQNNFINNNIIIKKYKLNNCIFYENENEIIDNTILKKYNNLNNKKEIQNNLNNKQKEIQNNNEFDYDKIKEKYNNSNYEQKEIQNNNEFDYNKIKEKYNNPNYEKICNEKKEIQHNINILKNKTEKIKELKEVYDNDLKLFKLFNENINKDPNFIIPELFKEKNDIFKKLSDENKLSWENFIKLYGKNNYDYEKYFLKNNHEESYQNKILEEINI